MARLLTVLFLLGACTPREEPPATDPAPAPAPAGPCKDLELFRAKHTHALVAMEPAMAGAVFRWKPNTQVLAVDREHIEAFARLWIRTCAMDAIVALTTELVAFETVSAEHPPAEGGPFDAMAEHLAARAKDSGMTFEVVGKNDAWEMRFGQGQRHIAFVTHADVVPVAAVEPGSTLPPGWTQPPFSATRTEGRLYGRGTEDDKGSIATLIVLFETMQRFGLQPAGQIVLVMGTGEESDWSGMSRYAKEAPKAHFTISVDSTYPLVTAESGFVAWHLAVPVLAFEPKLRRTRRHKTSDPARITALSGGEFLTQVPGRASMTVSAKDMESLSKRLSAVLDAERSHRKKLEQTYEISSHTKGNAITVTVEGEAVHSSTADSGHNALWPLARIAGALQVHPDGHARMLNLIAKKFDGDHWGEKLELAYADKFMGKLLVAPTVLRVEEGQVRLSINMRRPAGRDKAAFLEGMNRALKKMQAEIHPELSEYKDAYVGDPFVADAEGPLVSTLLDIYRMHTGDKEAKAGSIRGGTYARLFEGAVDFGPAMPGLPYRGHAPDEYLELSALGASSAMLFEAILRLDKMAAK